MSLFPRPALRLALAFVTLVSVVPVHSQQGSYASLLARVDAAVTFEGMDLAAEYLIEKRDPNGVVSTTRATMFRRDSADQFVILIMEPTVDKGKGYLKIGDNLWLYDPIGRTFTFTSAKERFQNSGARNSDFSRSNYARDYRVASGEPVQLGKFACTLLTLEALTDKVSFPKVRIWVSDDNLVRKIEDYSLSGQLIRTTAIPTYQKVGERWVPQNLVIQDNLKYRQVNGKTEYERTSVLVSRPSLKPLPDSVYSKDYLERVSK